MRATVTHSNIEGSVSAPPSKSLMHRVVVCGLLSSGVTEVRNPLFCDDTSTTLSAAAAMGAVVEGNDPLRIKSTGRLVAPPRPIDCKSSGTTLRFFSALAALSNGKTILTGDRVLMARPMDELLGALRDLGVSAELNKDGDVPQVEIVGSSIQGGSIEIRGDISSQFISALLLIGPKTEQGITIDVSSSLESRPYVQITIDIMRRFGVSLDHTDDLSRITVNGRQEYRAGSLQIEGDYSSAAFLFAAGALAGNVFVSNLNPSSCQGDAKILNILEKMGAEVSYSPRGVRVRKNNLNSLKIDVGQIPDLVPVLAVLGSQAEGTTVLEGIQRLRWKESDRITATLNMLRGMGAKIEAVGNAFVIRGPTRLRGTVVDPHRDHRIAMAAAVAGLVAEGETVIEAIECVSKSYPGFVSDLAAIGGQVYTSGGRSQ